MRWQNFTDSGSPPCSPQMPTFRFGRVLRPLLGGHLHQLADAFLIQHGKRILLEDSLLQVLGQELVDVVAREAEGRLRQVVGAEAEELGLLGDLSATRAARGSSIMVPTRYSTVRSFSAKTSSATRRTMSAWFFISLMPLVSGIMISGCTLMPFFLHFDGRLDDGARLHLGDLRIGDSQTAAAQSEHRVRLVQFFHAGEQCAQLLQLRATSAW